MILAQVSKMSKAQYDPINTLYTCITATNMKVECEELIVYARKSLEQAYGLLKQALAPTYLINML